MRPRTRTPHPLRRRPLAVIALSVLVLAACSSGSSDDAGDTTTRPPSTSRSTSAAAPSSTTPTTTPPTTTAPATTVPATAPATTRPPTADGPGPAFDPAQAEAHIRGLGSWDPDMTTYDPAATLSAVVASASGSGSGGAPMQVFFFSFAHYLCTATSEPRIALGISATEPEAVTISYSHFAPADPFCCPSNAPYLVTFRLVDGIVVPEGELPPEGQGLT